MFNHRSKKLLSVIQFLTSVTLHMNELNLKLQENTDFMWPNGYGGFMLKWKLFKLQVNNNDFYIQINIHKTGYENYKKNLKKTLLILIHLELLFNLCNTSLNMILIILTQHELMNLLNLNRSSFETNNAFTLKLNSFFQKKMNQFCQCWSSLLKENDFFGIWFDYW